MVAWVLSKVTRVNPWKMLPVIVIVSPAEPVEGEMLLITGGGCWIGQVKEAVPPAVVIWKLLGPVEPNGILGPTLKMADVFVTSPGRMALLTPLMVIVFSVPKLFPMMAY